MVILHLHAGWAERPSRVEAAGATVAPSPVPAVATAPRVCSDVGAGGRGGEADILAAVRVSFPRKAPSVPSGNRAPVRHPARAATPLVPPDG
ncbi:hypothetical protein SEA_UNTPL_40 [Streptomyces phage UNTPL]|nr:hypothetical protein SEA_UNTPL_40 [Streptomyces phage UNTPL]